ncbi:hypothetical protein ACS0TY_003722 [Phlomoides rotata]
MAESNQAADSESDQDEMALFIKQFIKFVKQGKSYLKKGSSKPTAEESLDTSLRPETKKYTDDEKASRVERKRK